MLDDFYPRALQWCTKDDIPEDDVVSIDISKCYPSVLIDNAMPIPVYSIHDVVEKFSCKNDLRKDGEFYIDEYILPNFKAPIKIEAGFYSSALVSFLVDELNMPTTQIKYKITTKKALKPDTFKDYIEYIFNNFKESEAKKMTNAFIGDLGRKYNKTNHGFTCSDYDTALCCWTSALSEGKNLTIDNYKDIYLIKEQKVERLFSDHTSVNRFVVSQGILKCLKLLFACHGENSEVYGVNTDGIYLSNPSMKFKNKKDAKFKTKHIGKEFTTDSKLVYFEKHYRDNLDMTDYKVKKGDGCIYKRGAGCGKTTLLCKMVKEETNPLVLSFTNTAIENVKNRLVKNGYKDANKICHTFDSYFCEWNGRDFDSLKDKTIFIEELSMVPNKWITLIYKAFTMFNNVV